MPRFRLVIEYDGTEFCGYQRQPGRTTVQGALETALKHLGCQVEQMIVAGRTDTGVHALNQVLHWDGECPLPVENLRLVLNRLLPLTINVKRAEVAPVGFHARNSAVRRVYAYVWQRSPTARTSPFQSRYTVGLPPNCDTALMQQAARSLIGVRDFSAFCASGNEIATRRRIYAARVAQHGDRVIFMIAADGFVRSMVRIAAGTLQRVGEGELTQEGFAALLESGDRTQAGDTAPARGLYLFKIYYRTPRGIRALRGVDS